MRRFSFSLEKVLELRRYDEREWELKLAEVTSRVLSVEHEIESWGQRRHSTTAQSVAPGEVNMRDMRGREDYVSLIDVRVRELQSRLVALEAEREKVRQRYLEVSRRRKALSRLKERRGDEYYREAAKDETRAIDDIAASMMSRRRRESEERDV